MGKFKPENWQRLVSEERRAHLPPDVLLDAIGVEEGSTVADIGAGPGYFTLPLVERVGATGRVYALDVQPEMIEVLHGRDLPPQVRVVRSGESELPLEDASVDLALVAFVYHEVEDPRAFLAEAGRVLRPGGRLVVAEWEPREEEIGPPLHERLPREVVERGLREGEFAIVERGRHDSSVYYVVARREERPRDTQSEPRRQR